MGGNPDVTGFVLNQMGRGQLFAPQLFLSAAFLSFANKEAGCGSAGEICEDDDGTKVWLNGTNTTYYLADDEDCGRVWGLKPATLITMIIMIGSLVSSILMPFVGSLADHTKHRRTIGRNGLLVCWFCTAVQVSVSKDTWKFLMFVQRRRGTFRRRLLDVCGGA